MDLKPKTTFQKNVVSLNSNRTKNLVFFFLYILSRPKLLLLTLKNIYIPAYVQYGWLNNFHVGTIIDIGANQGNVTIALASLCPQADIYAFEPVKYECDTLKRKTRRFPNVTVANIALSNKNGKTAFYLNRLSPTSSLLPLSSFGEKIVHSHAKKITVQTITLDSYFRNKKLKRPIFVKIDVQGAEEMVFQGASKLLKKTSIIHVESGFEVFYKNQCLFGDIYQLLTHHGFEYHGSNTDADFYPNFAIPYFENSLFIKKHEASEK